MFKLRPKWVVIGCCVLAFLSAAVNAGFFIQLGTSVSHLTGDVSKVAVDAVRDSTHLLASAKMLAMAAFSFLVGAMVAGFFIHHPTLDMDRPYGRSVMTIGGCLLGAHFALVSLPWLAVGLAGFAFGFQNALASDYRGMVLRTTHLTGLLTDLGVHLGMRFKGHSVPSWKLIVQGALILSFFGGSVFGALMVLRWQLPFVLLISGVYLSLGIGLTVLKHWVVIPEIIPEKT